jgi:hypothetical protein
MKVYIAGKVSKDSSFGGHHWRDDFCAKLSELSGFELENLDPLEKEAGLTDAKDIFAKDCQLIAQCDVFIVYLSDDISVGGSQEMLIARYLNKPVLGLAPTGGKFNGSSREMLGTYIENYQDPFVFSTCDVVCGSIEELAEALKTADQVTSSGLSIIDDAIEAA